MNEFIIHHTGGEFLVRTSMQKADAAEAIEAKWGLEIESIEVATAEDIEINEGQWTEMDVDA